MSIWCVCVFVLHMERSADNTKETIFHLYIDSRDEIQVPKSCAFILWAISPAGLYHTSTGPCLSLIVIGCIYVHPLNTMQLWKSFNNTHLCLWKALGWLWISWFGVLLCINGSFVFLVSVLRSPHASLFWNTAWKTSTVLKHKCFVSGGEKSN